MPSTENDITEFYSENVTLSKLTPVPVPAVDVTEQMSVRDIEGCNDYYDLDQDTVSAEEFYSYHNEHDASTNVRSRCFDANTSCEMTSVKIEPVSDFARCAQHRCSSTEFAPVETEESFWNMKSKIMNECAQDVEETCRCLGISPDPMHWSPAQAQQWIVWQCRQFMVPQPNMEYFHMPGTELCNLSEEELKLFAPEGQTASVLFSRLEVWRSVVEQTNNRLYANFPPQITRIPVPRSPSLPASPDSLNSSTCSSFSDTESQPLSPPAMRLTGDDKDRLPEEPVHHHRQTIQLWQFLKLLLLDGGYSDCIRWVDKSRGIFKIENSVRVAKLWGKRKNRPAMNYDKLSRSIRQYYKKNIIKKTEHSKRLVYQFCKM